MAFFDTPTKRVSKLLPPLLLADVEPVRRLARAQTPDELTPTQREAIEAMVMILWAKFHALNGNFFISPHIDHHLQNILEKSGSFLGSDYVRLPYTVLECAFDNYMMPADMPNYIAFGRASGANI